MHVGRIPTESPYATSNYFILDNVAIGDRLQLELCTKFERNRAFRGGVIAFSIFDLL